MIERTDDDGIVTLRLDHGKANALDLELVEALARAVAEINVAGTRAIILTGTGSIFSAGVDLYRLLAEGAPYVDRFVPAMSRMFLDLFTLEKPVVAAINGHAIAGGCILALMADHRVMADGSGRMGVPELVVGVPFPPMVLELLRFAIPMKTLQSLAYSGRTLTAEEAAGAGLVEEIAPAADVATRAMTVARHLASLPAAAFALTKRQLRDIANDRARGFAAKYDQTMLESWKSEAAHAHIRSYLDRTVRKK